MKNLTDIKLRIKSVSDTRQITGAMETISISKMRKAMQKYESSRIFFEKIYEVISDIVARSIDMPEKYYQSKSNRKIYIVIASDRGLAGGFNTNVCKFALKEIQNSDSKIIAVGHTVEEFFRSRGLDTSDEFVEYGFGSHKNAANITNAIMPLFLSGEVGEMNIIYTKMLNHQLMQPQKVELLPLKKQQVDSKRQFELESIEYDPSPLEVLDKLVPQYVMWVIYGALIHSEAAEHYSRRFAMSNATKNATDILDELKLEYNIARQEAITNEISEIITSGQGVRELNEK